MTRTTSIPSGDERRPRRPILALALCVAAVLVATLVGGADAAYAVGGYHTSGSGVRVRAGASTQTAQISSIPAAGTPIDIACQTSGETVTAGGFGTSAVWDKLNGYGGGYISDLFVKETPYAQFDPRIPLCGAAPPPPAYVTSATVNVRGAPSFNATLLGTVGGGTPIMIQCQTYGTKWGGSFIWDRIAGGYISDVYVNGTPFNAFDARLPRCGDGYKPVDCSHPLFIGARGSGEPLDGRNNLGGPGSPVDETYRRLAALGMSIDVAGVIYEAQGVDILPTQVGPYFAGAQHGVAVLLDNLRGRTNGNVCGWQNTRVLLVGYSQGALVVGDAIEQMTPQERSTVLGVVTYGNPRYTPFVNGATGGMLISGILGIRQPYPDGVNGRSRDYCRRDIVCQLGSLNVQAHLGYVSPGPEVDSGVTYLAGRLGF